MKIEVKVENASTFEKLYHYLRRNGYSKNFLSKLKDIYLNGETANFAMLVIDGNIISFDSEVNPKMQIKPCKIALEILFEDEYYLIVNKPSDLCCMPNRSHFDENLSGAILNYMGDNFIVRILNRLDKDTSGIVILAKTAQGQNANVEKTYYALASGVILKDFVIDKKIETICINGINERKRIISDTGKAAITKVFVLRNYSDTTLVKLNLIHGRTHQIRVHLASENHPLIGDSIYGNESNEISHTALVLKEIKFTHPFKNNIISITIDYPDDFKSLLARN